MILKRTFLSRRMLLRGCGAAIALPLLDVMHPAMASVRRTARPPSCRMFVNYVPNGIIMKHFTPPAGTLTFELPRVLKPMAPYRDSLLLISGMQQHWGFANQDGAGDHSRAAASYLTGVHVKKTSGADIQVGISMDQVVAQHIGHATRLPSLELTCEDGRVVGFCDIGYSCVYSNTISWRSARTPSSAEVNPRAVFERLFGSEDDDPAARVNYRRYEKSILDWVIADAHSLKRTLGAPDRRKLDEYLTAVRDIERRIQKTERANNAIRPNMAKPDATPVDLCDHLRLMYDLLALAFQTDTTRVATLMIGREASLRTYREIHISDSHHPLTHHQGNPDLIEKVCRINCYHMQLFSEFVGKLARTPDGDGTLLDHTMILYGSGLSDGDKHQHDHLPVMLVGGACGTIKAGRHVVLSSPTPLNNLYISMLSRMGIPVEHLGDSTGMVKELDSLA